MNFTPSLLINTRQKYSPSSSHGNPSFHGPAASVNSRLTSHEPGCIQVFFSIFNRSHSTGGKSSQRTVRVNFARLVRNRKCPHSDDSKIRLLLKLSANCICH